MWKFLTQDGRGILYIVYVYIMVFVVEEVSIIFNSG